MSVLSFLSQFSFRWQSQKGEQRISYIIIWLVLLSTALYNKGQYLFFKRKPDLVISITQITNDLSGMFFISAENEFAVDLLTVALAWGFYLMRILTLPGIFLQWHSRLGLVYPEPWYTENTLPKVNSTLFLVFLKYFKHPCIIMS